MMERVRRVFDLAPYNDGFREQFIRAALQGLPQGSRILDAGAGQLRYKKYCSHLSYVSQDFAQYSGAGNGAGLQTGTWDVSGIDIVCDITAIPEADETFDAILCAEVFEHIPDPLRALGEFHRLLKPKGTLILTTPFASLTHFAPYHHYSGFNEYFFRYHFSGRFLILKYEKSGNFFLYLAQELTRIPRVYRRYGVGRRMNALALAAAAVLSLYLRRMSHLTKGSEELLYFGNHIVAERI